MSLGCGTLASPSAFQKGTLGASSSNGTQHTLPKNPMHRSVAKLSITNHWAEDQEQGPTRLWGSSMKTKLGGEERPDGCADNWTKGEFWNVDSNIRIWGPHEVRRNGASASHDVHRHDQIRRICLPALPGQERFEGRQCVSGVVGADTCFLEAWGFSLGRRDRQARPVGIFLPTGANEQFRSHRSFDRDLGRMTESFRTMRRSQTTPGTIMPATATTLRPEDVGGDAGELADYSDAELSTQGRTHGSRSCHYWDRYDHATRREAAKMACSIHSPSLKFSHHYPHKELELNPASVYTLKYRKFGENHMRDHQAKENLSSPSGSKTVKTIKLKPAATPAAS